jgi:hypothetical protein
MEFIDEGHPLDAPPGAADVRLPHLSPDALLVVYGVVWIVFCLWFVVRFLAR